MRQIIVLVLFIASATSAYAQRDLKEDYAKMARCLLIADTLIGMTIAALRAKCGQLYKSNTTITVYGRSEQLVYGHGSYVGMYVYVDNGIVTAVQVRGR